MPDKDILAEAREAFEQAAEAGAGPIARHSRSSQTDR